MDGAYHTCPKQGESEDASKVHRFRRNSDAPATQSDAPAPSHPSQLAEVRGIVIDGALAASAGGPFWAISTGLFAVAADADALWLGAAFASPPVGLEFLFGTRL
jgi:hypothetical protein